MALSHSSSLRNSFATAVHNAINAGSGPGKLILKAGATILGTIILNDPAGSVSGATLTIDVDPLPEDPAADAAGTIDAFEFRDSDNNLVLSGTVTATGGGGDLTIATTSIPSGNPLRLDSFVYTAPL